MYYFQRNSKGELKAVKYENLNQNGPYITRHDFATMADAQDVANELNGFPELNIAPFSDDWMAVDGGRSVSPRFDVVRKPKVGEPVSMAFNGDYYPDGYIAKISPTMKKITTTTGTTYYRRRQTASWLRNGKTFSMVGGHIDKRNPSF